MKRPWSRILVVVATGALLAFASALAFFGFFGFVWVATSIGPQPSPRGEPARSAREARERGTWVRDVSITPGGWQGHDIQFLEAWVEESAWREDGLGGRSYRRTGGQVLCFRLAKGRELFQPPWPACFQLEPKPEGFDGEGNFGIDYTYERPGTFSTWSAKDFTFPLRMGIAAHPSEAVESYDFVLEAKAQP